MSKPQIMAMNVCVAPKSTADRSIRARTTVMPVDIASGIGPSPDHDLIFNGGRTIANLNFCFYAGGAESWQVSDMQSIDTALSAAMSDRNLNNVIVQYFPGGQITSKFLGSQCSPAPRQRSSPKAMSKRW